MNKIKNTLLTLASQLILAGVVALLTQQAAQAQSDVNVVNTPTVRIDPRANQVKVVNSSSSPIPVTVIEEPIRLVVPDESTGPSACVLLPLSTERWSVFEQVAIATRTGKVSNATLRLGIKVFQNTIYFQDIYDIPLNEKGRGQLQLKLNAKGFLNYLDAAIGDVLEVQVCYDTPSASSKILVIATGHLLPQ